MLDKVKNI